MTEAKQLDLNAKMGETDLAYHILKETGAPLHYRALIDRVLEVKAPQAVGQVQAIAAVYTQINLDTRFAHLGEGQWGLKAWLPGKNSRRVPLITLLHKSRSDDDRIPLKRDSHELSVPETPPGAGSSEALSFLGEADSDEEEWED